MHDHSFMFNATDMYTAYGLRIRVKHGLLKPQLRPRKIVIPQRSGAYDFGAQYYDERQLPIECDTLKQLTAAEKRELAYLLSSKGKIVFWDEPDKFYKGRIYDTTEIEKVGGIGTYLPLVFMCDPFAYGSTQNAEFPSSGTLKPEYAGTAETPTRIEITNTGANAANGIQITIRKRRENI